MNELIGYKCSIVFNLPDDEWPISGHPAWAVCEDVDMPMIKLDGTWINAGIIKTISPYRVPGHYIREPNWEGAPHSKHELGQP